MALKRQAIIVATPLLLCGAAFGAYGDDGTLSAATFSVAAYDAETREWGIAVASKVLAVGYVVPWAKAGVGAVATQAYANLDYGVEGLALLEKGLSARDVLERLREKDEEAGRRQVAVVDAAGDVAAFTGADTLPWSGHIAGEGYSVQGNILTGEEVLKGMERAYLNSSGPLGRRLLGALVAGEAAGGDKRGKQSAALLVVRAGGGYQGKTDRLVDIRVDDHLEPVAELERIYNLWEQRFLAGRYLELGGEREAAYALAIMARVVAEGPEDAAALNDFAWALATKKLYPQKALEMALRAHELAPDDANVMDTVAEAYYAAGENEKAVAWEEKALAQDPGNDFFEAQLRKFEEAAAKVEEVQR
ncbi:MAG: DUF1028 domain-containing protein [candidate division Zixibacteria bacterium]|nr:DUF1028 domain-containing protein [candidate division Zixibacteria bacterium]